MRLERVRLAFLLMAAGSLLALLGLEILPTYIPSRTDNLTDMLLLDPYLVDKMGSALKRKQLPDLQYLRWPTREAAPRPSGMRDANGSVYALPEAFNPVVSRGQHRLFVEMLHLFTKVMVANNYTDRFILYGGTLLGSYRHHDIIPWDDDLDLVVDEQIRPQVQELLKRMEPDYSLHIQSGRDKFFRMPKSGPDNETDGPFSRKSSPYSWGWPYLDIAYYRKNETYLCEIARSYGREYCWPNNLVFPLLYRPLGPHWFPSPFDTRGFLELTYSKLQECRVSGYSHVLEGAGPSGYQPCSSLITRYAFVRPGTSKQKLYSAAYPNLAENMIVTSETLTMLTDWLQPTDFHVIHLPTAKRVF